MSARTNNFRGSREKPAAGPFRHCRTCCDMGVVNVGVEGRTGTDQGAPCPHCTIGLRYEFGDPLQPPYGGLPWGPEGYWRGRPTSGLEAVCRCDTRRDPRAAERLRALVMEVGASL